VLGLVRDMARAWLFGTGMAADAFTVAFRIPNMLRALFAEGALSASLVPVLADYVEKEDRAAVDRFLRSMATVLYAALAVTVLLGIALSPVLVPAIVHGFDSVPGKVELTVRLTQILFPYILLIGAATLAMAVLTTYRHFTTPALAPAALNVVLIVATVGIAPRVSSDPVRQIHVLAGAVLVGGLLQAAIQWPALRARGLSLRPSAGFRHPGVSRVLGLMLPGILGISVQEISVFVDMWFASALPQGSVAALEYGQRVMQLPLGVFGVALGTAVLPTLSRQISRGERDQAEDTTAFSIRLALLVLLPAGLWLILLAQPILALLFQRGRFTGGDSLRMTAWALQYFSIGLVFYGTAKSLVPLFYAHKDTRTPVRASIAALAVNIGLNVILVRTLGLRGLALSTALASLVNVTLLAVWARRKLRLDPFRGCARPVARLGSAALFSAVVAWAAYRLFAAVALGGLAGRLLLALGPLALAAAAYAVALERLRAEEWTYLRGIVAEKLGRSRRSQARHPAEGDGPRRGPGNPS